MDISSTSAGSTRNLLSSGMAARSTPIGARNVPPLRRLTDSMFAFHSELFEDKARAQAALARAGINWLSDYSNCDILHEEYGLEIEDMAEKVLALRALEILRATFPRWPFTAIWFRGHHGDRWCVSICKLKRVCD